MSYATATGAQRLELNSAATALAAATQNARSGLNGLGLTGHSNAETAAARCQAALTAIGVGATLPSTQAVLTDGLSVTGVSITGTGSIFTPAIVDGVLTGGVLSAE